MNKEREKSIDQLNRADIEAYIAKFIHRKEAGDIGQRTVKFAATNVKMFAKWLVKEEMLSSQEFFKINEDLSDLRGEKGEDNRTALSEAEEKEAFRKLPDVFYVFVMWLGVNFGPRLQEMCHARISHVDLNGKRRLLKIELSKGHDAKTRYIPISPRQAQEFMKWLNFRNALNLKHDFLLYNPIDPSKPLTEYSLGWIFQKMTKITGIHLYCHRLRYTYAVKLWKHHVDLWIISQALGHEKIETTVKYLKIRQEDYFDNYEKMTKGMF